MVSVIATKSCDATAGLSGVGRLSPLARRLLAVNVVALLILVGGVMILGRYQTRLLQAELEALRTEARIFAGALGEGAVAGQGANVGLEADLALRMVRRLAEPTEARTRLYGADGVLLADTGVTASLDGVESEAGEGGLPPASRWLLYDLERLYEVTTGDYPSRDALPIFEERGSPPTASAEGSGIGSLSLEVQRALAGRVSVVPWTTRNHGLMLTAVMPVKHGARVLGALLLTQTGARIEAAVESVRVDILHCFGLALLVTVALSLYLAGTIVGPIRRLALAADRVRRGHGRPRIPDLSARHDEIGELSLVLSEMTDALWARMDAIERFAADVAHEIKNPLTSLRSAVETVARVNDPERRRQLMVIIEDDVRRLDRLISDISAASRLDAELSRAELETVDLGAMLRMLAELHTVTTQDDSDAPRLVVASESGETLKVPGFQSRLVQVLQNLIANALSFSPPGGAVVLAARRDGASIEITVSDQGPGIPEGKLAAIFERFYSERPPTEKFGTHSGLGLSISKQIVEAHRGTIVAENRIGADGAVVGAVFTVRLPRLI